MERYRQTPTTERLHNHDGSRKTKASMPDEKSTDPKLDGLVSELLGLAGPEMMEAELSPTDNLETELEPINPFKTYLREIGKIPLIGNEREQVLGHRMSMKTPAQNLLLSMHEQNPPFSIPLTWAIEFSKKPGGNGGKPKVEKPLSPSEQELLDRSEEGLMPEEIAAKKELLQRKVTGFEMGDKKVLEVSSQFLRGIVKQADEAERELVEANLRWAVRIARKNEGKGLALLDLIQEANQGLIRAAQLFDYRKGFRFTTYATPWIRQKIGIAIAEQVRPIKTNWLVKKQLNTLSRNIDNLTIQLKRKPTDIELCAEYGYTRQQLMDLRQFRETQTISSLDKSMPGSEDWSNVIQSEEPGPEEEVMTTMLKEAIAGLLSKLSEKERQVLKLRFGIGDNHPRTLEETGREIGLVREQVRQIEKNALIKLNEIKHPSLKEFLT
ncbi:MAG: sigma-70 family RNA polymerase sigma factor [bacterium]|nr:sigma-70 family RNA polymerase sigma factor [bacterium]